LQHGVSEILQALGQGQTQGEQTFVSSSIVFNGKTYRSVDELPPHLRAMFEHGMQEAQRALGTSASNVMIQSVTTQASFEIPVHGGSAIGPLPALPAPIAVEFVQELASARRKGGARMAIILAAVAILLAAGAAIVFAR
jgi:hypothetical protein